MFVARRGLQAVNSDVSTTQFPALYKNRICCFSIERVIYMDRNNNK